MLARVSHSSVHLSKGFALYWNVFIGNESSVINMINNMYRSFYCRVHVCEFVRMRERGMRLHGGQEQPWKSFSGSVFFLSRYDRNVRIYAMIIISDDGWFGPWDHPDFQP